MACGFDFDLGILIHQLPQSELPQALESLPRDICRQQLCGEGWQVFFRSKESAESSVHLGRIVVHNVAYNIYPLVTCLTIYGIQQCASVDEVHGYLKRRHKEKPFRKLYAVSGTPDYRVVLEIPEVLATFQPPTICLSRNRGTYMTAFFCRLCRQNGHKQFQCLRRGAFPSREVPQSQTAPAASKNPTCSLSNVQEIRGCNSSRKEPTTKLKKGTGSKCKGNQGDQKIQATAKKKKKSHSLKGRISRNRIIQKLISKGQSPLPPPKMTEFLEKVFHRKEILPIVVALNVDIHALVEELEAIKNGAFTLKKTDHLTSSFKVFIENLVGRLKKLPTQG